ncbi:cytochrome P450 [Saccharothrix xinjiangensis]|uniref:Cytochrome P450 n=1 Tax=Saccharothrix xinjiangensis TaxID=204798 RepID=A0ABV9Y3A6_9PSEU
MTTTVLPPGPSVPRAVQGAYALTVPGRGVRQMRERYGDAFSVNVPIFGHALVLANPAEVKQLFLARSDAVENIRPNLGRVLGPGSFFALVGEAHREQRKLLVPPFHGRRLAAFERIVEDEAARELASWPRDREFATLPSMMRITLNAILRAVFGARGAELDRLRRLLPTMVTLGSRLASVPLPRTTLGPWGWFRRMRRRYDEVVDRLITAASRDDRLDDRDDVLALLVQSRHDDGSPLGRDRIADQLLTLLSAGHETTATTLAWAVERIRRHPDVLRGLVEEVDAGGRALRDATLLEVQRTRPVIDLVGRMVTAESFELGRWTLPRGHKVLVGISLLHGDDSLFPNAAAFDPNRFLDAKPDLYEWIPFGGGTRRCIGAAFATMEMDVVLRTLLRDFHLDPTDERDERWHLRGVANAPGRGGRAVVRRRDRTTRPAPPTPTGPRAANT